VDGPVTNWVVVSNPSFGVLSGTPPNLTYRGNTNYYGPDSFTFRVNDGSLTSAVATVTIALTNVNDAPIAFSQSVTNAEDVSFAITLTALDVDGPVTNWVVVSNPGFGTLSGTPPNLTYRGNTNYFGPDSFTFQVNDGSLTSAVATVTITLNSVNDAPMMPVLSDYTIAELTLLTVTNTAPDADGDGLSYQLLEAPAGAVIDTNGVITWTPTEAQGPTTNTIITVVSDGELSATNSFVVVVLEVNEAPEFVAPPELQTVVEGNLLTVTNHATDGDLPANVLSYQLVESPAGAVVDAAGVITWTPSQGPGTNTMTTVVTDDGEPPLSATNSFVVVVTPAPVPPVALDDAYDLGGEPVLHIAAPGVLNNDTDPQGATLTATLVEPPQQGVLVFQPTGAFEYTPTNHFVGVDTFAYQASNGWTNCHPATVSVAVSNRIQFTSITVSNDVVSLVWTAISGKNYRLQYQDDWAGTNWVDLGPDISATANRATAAQALPSGASPGQRFYRVWCPGW
jgi:hypothetical protein